MKKITIYYSFYLLSSLFVLTMNVCPSMGWGGFFPLWKLTVILSGPINYMLIYLAFPFYLVFTAIHFSLVMKIHNASVVKTKALIVAVTIVLWFFMGWITLGNTLFL